MQSPLVREVEETRAKHSITTPREADSTIAPLEQIMSGNKNVKEVNVTSVRCSELVALPGTHTTRGTCRGVMNLVNSTVLGRGRPTWLDSDWRHRH